MSLTSQHFMAYITPDGDEVDGNGRLIPDLAPAESTQDFRSLILGSCMNLDDWDADWWEQQEPDEDEPEPKVLHEV